MQVQAEDIAPDLHEPLRLWAIVTVAAASNLLGSGWVEVSYGIVCDGFAGRSFPRAAPLRGPSRWRVARWRAECVKRHGGPRAMAPD